SHDKPSLSALPSHIVPQGQNVTLTCDTHSESYTFKLYKEYGAPVPQLHEGIFQKNYVLGPMTQEYSGTYRCYHNNHQNTNELSSHSDPLKIIISGPVTPHHAGTYTCYGSYNHTPYEWSESSDPVDIKITGLYKKPSLSAMTGPVVMSGENMTLSCISDHQFDMFHLSREGVPQGHGLPAVQNHSGKFQANFILGPVTQKALYRCYGSFSNSSHVWSSPSDPLYLSITVNSTRKCTSCTEPYFKTNNHKNMHILIGLSVTMILVFLIILLYFSCLAKKSKSQKQASECQLSIVRNKDWRHTAIMDQDSDVRTTLNSQDPEQQEEQEVAYLEFDQMTFQQKLTSPISQSLKEFSTDPSLYMEVRKC
ncbi:hypothetical protein STEG23_038382, partial [Scotinomys teguina]